MPDITTIAGSPTLVKIVRVGTPGPPGSANDTVNYAAEAAARIAGDATNAAAIAAEVIARTAVEETANTAAANAAFLLANAPLSPAGFEAVGDGVTDDSGALIAMFADVALKATGNTFFPVNLNGLTYATSKPLVLPPNVVLFGGAFKALPGTAWAYNNAVLSNTGGFNIVLRDIYIDLQRVPKANGVICTQDGGISYWNVVVTRWKGVARVTGSCTGTTLTIATTDYGVLAAGQVVTGPGVPFGTTLFSQIDATHWTLSSAVRFSTPPTCQFGMDTGNGFLMVPGAGGSTGKPIVFACRANQFSHSDPEYSTPNVWTGWQLGCYGNADGSYHDFEGFAGQGIYVDDKSFNLRFDGIHPYFGNSSGIKPANAVDIHYAGAHCTFVNMYWDDGAFNIYATGSVDVQITSPIAAYITSGSDFPYWFNLIACDINCFLNKFVVTGGSYKTVPLFNFVTAGAGVWQGITPAAIAALQQIANTPLITGSMASVYPGFDGLGVSNLQGFMFGSNPQTTSYALQNSDSMRGVVFTQPNCICTLPGTTLGQLQDNTLVLISGQSDPVTIAVDSAGATLNGGTEPVTVLPGGTAFALQLHSDIGMSFWSVFGNIQPAIVPQTIAAITASPFTFTATAYGSVVSTGMVGSAVFKRGQAATVILPNADFVMPVSPGDTVIFTYTVAPTVTFVPT